MFNPSIKDDGMLLHAASIINYKPLIVKGNIWFIV